MEVVYYFFYITLFIWYWFAPNSLNSFRISSSSNPLATNCLYFFCTSGYLLVILLGLLGSGVGVTTGKGVVVGLVFVSLLLSSSITSKPSSTVALFLNIFSI